MSQDTLSCFYDKRKMLFFEKYALYQFIRQITASIFSAYFLSLYFLDILANYFYASFSFFIFKNVAFFTFKCEEQNFK